MNAHSAKASPAQGTHAQDSVKQALTLMFLSTTIFMQIKNDRNLGIATAWVRIQIQITLLLTTLSGVHQFAVHAPPLHQHQLVQHRLGRAAHPPVVKAALLCKVNELFLMRTRTHQSVSVSCLALSSLLGYTYNHSCKPPFCCAVLKHRSFSPTKSLLVDTIRVVIDDMKVTLLSAAAVCTYVKVRCMLFHLFCND